MSRLIVYTGGPRRTQKKLYGRKRLKHRHNIIPQYIIRLWFETFDQTVVSVTRL